MQKDTTEKLSSTTITLHWLAAISMIGLLASGLYMYETKSYWLYNWHKSIGILIFTLLFARVLWRLHNGWPQPVSHYKNWEQRLSKSIHWVLIVATLLMPLSGFLHSASGGYGIYLFGIDALEIIPRNPDPEDPLNPLKQIPYSSFLDNLGGQIHKLAGYTTILAVTLHILGALKHHIIDRDSTLQRMMGKRVAESD